MYVMKKALVTTLVMVALMCGMTLFISVVAYLIFNYLDYLFYGLIAIAFCALLRATWLGIYAEVEKYYER